MYFEEDELLARLPFRGKAARPDAIDYSHTVVEAYVRDVVETVLAIPAAETVLAPVLQALISRGIVPPVTVGSLVDVLNNDVTVELKNQWAVQYAPMLGRMLRTLNGPAYALVPADVLKQAAHKEEQVSMLSTGWGHCDVPAYATAYRLLVSSGLSPDVLPPYKSLPAVCRERVMDAWSAACSHFGWERCQPQADVRAHKGHKTRQSKMFLNI
jgi:hypothetical protein